MTSIEEFLRDNRAALDGVFEAIDNSRDALIERVRVTAEIPAPTFDETRRTEYATETFSGAGLSDVHRLPKGSVLGFTGSAKSPIALLLAAHIDNVFPLDTDLTTRVDGNTLHGPGTGDNAANVAALITLAGIFKDLGVKPAANVAFAATVREEGLGNLGGMAEVLDELGDRVAAAIAVDGMMSSLMHRSQAISRYGITVKCAGGHSFNNFGVPSAIHEVANIVASLAAVEVPVEPRTTFNVGKIHGGRSVNAIAQECEAEVDLRSLEQETLDELESKFLSIAVAVRREGVEVITRDIGRKPAAAIDPGHDLVQTAVQSAKHVGIEPELTALSTDAAMSLSRGIPSISFGTYAGKGTHTLEENIDLDSLTTGLKRLALTVLAISGVEA